MGSSLLYRNPVRITKTRVTVSLIENEKRLYFNQSKKQKFLMNFKNLTQNIKLIF